MNFRKLILLFIVSISFLSCAQEKNTKIENEEDGLTEILSKHYNISLVKLLSTPEKYHNKPIRVIGYLHLEFEGNAIYLNELDYKHSISKNGFWVSFKNKELMSKAIELNNKYVIIEGVFDAENFGHMGMFSGEIKNIQRVDLWSDSKK